jgi:putative lipoic acid-binding regulatory protein
MSELDSIIEYPLDFPIKVMGLNHPEFALVVSALVQLHAPDFDPATLESRPSREGKYVSLTATINATSRAQLDELYRALTAHPLVKMAL